MVVFGLLAVVIGYKTYSGGVFELRSQAARLSKSGSGVPTASPGEIICQTVSSVLSSVAPLQIPDEGTSYNKRNKQEKWFRDAKGQHYYIYPELPVRSQKLCRKGEMYENCLMDSDAKLPYIVKRPSFGAESDSSGTKGREEPLPTLNPGSDASVAIESKACYDAIGVRSFVFPSPVPSKMPQQFTCPAADGPVRRITNEYGDWIAAHCPDQNNGPSCIEVSRALAGVVPLKSTNNVFLNWGNIGEKWFQDNQHTWYYIYPNPTKSSLQGAEGKRRAMAFIVRRWAKELGLKPNGGNPNNDELITDATPQCYAEIVPNFTFPAVETMSPSYQSPTY